jgi:RNA polymerase sigma factor (sigma-70 family)
MNRHIPWQDRSIEVLGLSTRCCLALKRSNVQTLGQLKSLLSLLIDGDPTVDLLFPTRGYRNIGAKSRSEIIEKLDAYLMALPEFDPQAKEPKSGVIESAQYALAESHATEDPQYSLDNSHCGGSKREAAQLQPAWHYHSLLSLNLSARSRNALLRKGYESLGQLVELVQKPGPDDVGINQFGWKSFIELREKLEAHLATLPEADFELVGSREEVDEATAIKLAPLEEQRDISSSGRFAKWLSSLTDRQQEILAWRYGFQGEPLTLEEIGERLEITRERVRQIENAAIRKLRSSKHELLVKPLSRQGDFSPTTRSGRLEISLYRNR